MEATPVPVPVPAPPSATGGGMEDVLAWSKQNWQLILIGVLVLLVIIMASLWATGHFQDLPPSNQSTGSTNSLWWFGGGDAGDDVEDYIMAPGEAQCYSGKLKMQAASRKNAEAALAEGEKQEEMARLLYKQNRHLKCPRDEICPALTSAEEARLQVLEGDLRPQVESYTMAPGEELCYSGRLVKQTAHMENAEAALAKSAKQREMAHLLYKQNKRLKCPRGEKCPALTSAEKAKLEQLELELRPGAVESFDPYNPRGVTDERQLLESFEDVGPRGLAAIRESESGGKPVMQ